MCLLNEWYTPPLCERGFAYLRSHSSDSQTARISTSAKLWNPGTHTCSVASGLCWAFHGACEVYPQYATVELVEVHVINGILSVRRRCIRNECESSVLRFY